MKWIEFEDPEWVNWDFRERVNRFLCEDDGLPLIHYGLDWRLKLRWIWGPDDTIDHLARRIEERTDYKFTMGKSTHPWLGEVE
jgi:hypothetical protein